MSQTIASLIPAAIGVAISPAAIVELILVIFSRRRVPNTVAFVLTLVVLSAAAVAIGAAGEQATESSGNHTSTGAAVVLIVLGVLLLLLAIRNWRNRSDTSEPKVFQTIAGMRPPAAAFLALGATFLNPKNLVLLLAAGQTIGGSELWVKTADRRCLRPGCDRPVHRRRRLCAHRRRARQPQPRPRPGMAHRPQPADHGSGLRSARGATGRKGHGRARLRTYP